MPLDEQAVEAVWEKGRAMPDLDPAIWRRDQCGAWLHREHLESTESEFAWKIVKVVPGGEDEEVVNLQPFHRDNGFDIANHQPHCRVTAEPTQQAPGQTIVEPRNTSV